MTLRPVLLLVPALAACGAGLPEEITISGRILAERDADADPVAGAALSVRDVDVEPLLDAETDQDGAFSFVVPAGYPFYLTIDGDDLAPTSFTAYAGFTDFEVEDGLLWVRTDADMAAIREEFAACEAASEPGGVIEGEMHLYIEGQEFEDLPTILTGEVTAWEPDGTEHAGCYLPDEADPDAEPVWTGSTGRFAVFGLPEGPTTLEAWYTIEADTVSESSYYYAWLPEDGVVPLYPTLVSLL